MQTLVDIFSTFKDRGNATAFVYRTGVRRFTFSYGELYDLALRMARLLEEKGVNPGDRVLLWAPNSPWWGVVFWGCVARGAVVVPVDFMSGRERAEGIAGLAETRLVVQSRAKVERIDGASMLFAEHLEFLLAERKPLEKIYRPKLDDTAQLIYTSGTTGAPKGVILTHENLMANLDQVNRHIPVVTPEFRFLSLLPLSHMFEQMGGFFIPLSHGASIVYLRIMKPSAMVEAFREEGVDALVTVPRLLQLLKSSVERELTEKGLEGPFRWLVGAAQNLGQGIKKFLFFPVRRSFGSRLRLFFSGGAALDPEVFAFWDALGYTVIEGYGLTECSPVLTANTMERQIPGSVGKALPGVELKLDEGELLARGANVFPGYFRNEEATRGAFTADGWFLTGDLGEIDAEGWLRIKGRSKELIVTGAGINVYPDELEELLNKAKGVREACVVGLNRGSGEEVHAVLLLDDSGRPPAEIVGEVNQSLDDLHHITGYSVWPEAEFPKTTTLKIRKFKVKEQLARKAEGAVPAAGAERLAVLIAGVTGASLDEVREESVLVADLGLTSIGRLELVNRLEQEYRLDLDDALIGPQTKVADLRAILDKREKAVVSGKFRFWTNSRPICWLRMLADCLINRPLFSFFVRLKAEGAEHLAKVEGPVIFAANHMSFLDQPAVMFSMPADVRYRTATAAWAEFFFVNFRNQLQKLWKRLCYEYGTLALNLFPLPQSSGFRESLRFMGRLADSGRNILIFPEGARSPDGRLLPFEQGLGLVVHELRLPVIPVKIKGLEHVLPRGANFPKRGDVGVTFGKPMEFGLEEPEAVVEAIRKAIEGL
ncbi:MAG: AMP-binding protein [Geobacter sp.]|nr:AMP-binding protein [Geobacter sp.]